MTETLRDLQTAAGASFDDSPVPISYGNDQSALGAARHGCALVDRSHWGRIQVSDDDRIRFLHNQSTNDFERLQPGQGCDTVFVTSTARTLDLATAYILEDEVLVLVSPDCRQSVLSWLDRYIFFADRVKLTDVTDESLAFSLIGPESAAILKAAGASDLPEERASHRLFTLGEITVRVAVGSGLASPGYTLIAAAEDGAALWQQLTAAGAMPLGEAGWEQLRVEQGRPHPGRELTEDYNPLEAGLWHTISFEKGCYIGQETIARLDTYKGVKQQLWGLKLSAPVELGSPVIAEDAKVGVLTSLVETEQGPLGLAYIRTKAGGSGLKVKVGESDGEVIDVPFLSRDRNHE